MQGEAEVIDAIETVAAGSPPAHINGLKAVNGNFLFLGVGRHLPFHPQHTKILALYTVFRALP